MIYKLNETRFIISLVSGNPNRILFETSIIERPPTEFRLRHVNLEGKPKKHESLKQAEIFEAEIYFA